MKDSIPRQNGLFLKKIYNGIYDLEHVSNSYFTLSNIFRKVFTVSMSNFSCFNLILLVN